MYTAIVRVRRVGKVVNLHKRIGATPAEAIRRAQRWLEQNPTRGAYVDGPAWPLTSPCNG
jgi:hypothetical protein